MNLVEKLLEKKPEFLLPNCFREENDMEFGNSVLNEVLENANIGNSDKIEIIDIIISHLSCMHFQNKELMDELQNVIQQFFGQLSQESQNKIEIYNNLWIDHKDAITEYMHKMRTLSELLPKFSLDLLHPNIKDYLLNKVQNIDSLDMLKTYLQLSVADLKEILFMKILKNPMECLSSLLPREQVVKDQLEAPIQDLEDDLDVLQTSTLPCVGEEHSSTFHEVD